MTPASINPLEKMVRNGEFKQIIKYKRPFPLGHDLSGVVTHVGAQVQDFKVGDEIYARPRDLRIGAFAEFIAIDQADVALKPKSLTWRKPQRFLSWRSRRGGRIKTSTSEPWTEAQPDPFSRSL